MDVAGKDITAYLRKSLDLELKDIELVKENLCYVSSDFGFSSKQTENNFSTEKSFELPDGKKITMSKERFGAPEILFNPPRVGIECVGLHQYCYDSIRKCDQDIRKELYNNLLLVGGSTLYNGIQERIWQELHILAPSSAKIKVVAPPDRKFSVWWGASILTSLSFFQQMWINKQEYDESGPSIVHRKCY